MAPGAKHETHSSHIENTSCDQQRGLAYSYLALVAVDRAHGLGFG